MRCLVVHNGAVVSVDVIAAATDCAGVVLLEQQDIPPNPFYMSAADGLIISGAIASLWILAFSYKAVRSVLHDKDS